MDEITTERLLLRPFQVDDLKAFVAYRSDPEVARYQSWDASYSIADAERFLASQRDVELGAPGAWVQLAAVSWSSCRLFALSGSLALCDAADRRRTRGRRCHHGGPAATERIQRQGRP